MKLMYWLVLLLVIISIPIFSHLDELPLQLWDESRLAMSAYEMSQSGNLLIPTFLRSPDMWSLKPPFMIWCMALSVKAFGVNELALRLPAALAAVATCLLLFFFINRVTKTPRHAFLSCLVLVTSLGYVRLHGIRTADYDSMLALFTTAYFVMYYLYLSTDRSKYLYYCFIALLFATMTKGIAALLLLPGLFVYTLYARKIKTVLTNKHFYIGTLMFLIPVFAYYFIREQYNPGYLKAVSENELFGRYTNVIEEHPGPWYFYLDFMYQFTFRYWLIPLGASVILVFFANDKEKPLLYYTGITAFLFMAVISASKTKLLWYDVPIYPLLAIVVGAFIDTAFTTISVNKGINNGVKISLISCVIMLIGAQYFNTFMNVSHPVKDYEMNENQYMASYMKDAEHGIVDVKNYVFTTDTKQDQNIRFYYELLKDKNNLKLKELEEINEGDTVIVFKKEIQDILKENYNIVQLRRFDNIKIYKVVAQQKQTTSLPVQSSNQ